MDGPHFLSPGPLIGSHSAIKDCVVCHTQSTSGKYAWLQRISDDDRMNDVKACVKCHKVSGNVLYAHTAEKPFLEAAQQRRQQMSEQIPKPVSTKVSNIMFPDRHKRLRNLLCADCHKEHQGKDFDLEAVSDGQCQACHVIQFDSFDGDHPAFMNFPFKRRTRIIYDHANHFRKYFPRTRRENPSRRIPESCSNCHTSHKDRRQMMLTSFAETCSGCHLDQILGKERISGPKGIAFLALPAIDIKTLRERNAPIGEWPVASEAEITPFMKVLLSRDQRGMNLLMKIDRIDLTDLRQATDGDIEAVTQLIWDIKKLFHTLISSTATDILASLPQDVIVAAQREWLPNLWSEMSRRADITGTGISVSVSETRLSANILPDQLPTRRNISSAGAVAVERSDYQRLAQAAAGAPIDNTTSAESWAKYGGWYRQDHAIYYRPTEHKDQFIQTWLDLTAPYAIKLPSNPARQIFSHLASKGMQGECVKCHSVDTVPGKGRRVNWSPALPQAKLGRFTMFVHEPHFGVTENKGCLTCHKLQPGAPYSKSFEQGNPQVYASSFGQVDKALCQSCHTTGTARQDCMLCHKYHINGIVTPAVKTRIPLQ